MTIGVLGAGQLGRMMALSGYPLGQQFLFLDREPGTPAHQVGASLFGDFTDPKLLDKMARHCEVVTVDWENVPAASLERLATRTRVAPPVLALATAQDRLREKILFTKLGIPTNSSMAVDSLADLHQATVSIGLPGVLKTRRMGYDGKGQFVLRTGGGCRGRLAAAGHGVAAVRGIRALRLRSVCDRRARPGRRNGACIRSTATCIATASCA